MNSHPKRDDKSKESKDKQTMENQEEPNQGQDPVAENKDIPKTFKLELIKPEDFDVLVAFNDGIAMKPKSAPYKESLLTVYLHNNEVTDEDQLVPILYPILNERNEKILAAAPLYKKTNEKAFVLGGLIFLTDRFITTRDPNPLFDKKHQHTKYGSGSDSLFPTLFKKQYVRYPEDAPVYKIFHIPNTSEIIIVGAAFNRWNPDSGALQNSSSDLVFIHYDIDTNKKLDQMDTTSDRGNAKQAIQTMTYVTPGRVAFVNENKGKNEIKFYDAAARDFLSLPMDEPILGLASSPDGRFILVKSSIHDELKKNLDKNKEVNPPLLPYRLMSNNKYGNWEPNNSYCRLRLYEITPEGLKFVARLSHGIDRNDTPQFLDNGLIAYTPAMGEFNADFNNELKKLGRMFDMPRYCSFVEDKSTPNTTTLEKMIYVHDIRTGKTHVLDTKLDPDEGYKYPIKRFITPSGEIITREYKADPYDLYRNEQEKALHIRITPDKKLQKLMHLDYSYVISAAMSRSGNTQQKDSKFVNPQVGSIISEYVGSDIDSQLPSWILDSSKEEVFMGKIDNLIDELRQSSFKNSRAAHRCIDCLERFKDKINLKEEKSFEECVAKLWTKKEFEDIKKQATKGFYKINI